MSNMSYARFQNTLTDFRDCVEALPDLEDFDSAEGRAARKLYELAREYIEQFEFNPGADDDDE